MEGWEDQIEIDDYDLHSLLRPQLLPSSSPLRPCSQFPSTSQSQISKNIQKEEEEEEEEEEENLPKLSTSRRLIPGPAGALQIAMRRRSASAASKRSLLEEEGSDDLDLRVGEQDEDFKLNPWLYSLSFLVLPNQNQHLSFSILLGAIGKLGSNHLRQLRDIFSRFDIYSGDTLTLLQSIGLKPIGD